MAGAEAESVKLTTGVAGLPVVGNARERLVGLYTEVLTELRRFPECSYRAGIEDTCIERLHIVEQHDDIRDIEKAVGRGQVEQLIEQAEAELDGLSFALEEKVWENEDNHQVPVLFHQ